MPALAEYCLPCCRPGGRLGAQKGDEAPAEAEAARGALEPLGGWLVEVKPLELPGLEAARYLVVVDKVAKTPELYPRRAGIPAKRPLG
jgi:16S rRNA (guanine527-N7)-methyltransferase